ncbi:helix-turn-helix domain-containing protein [Kibdelosporangium aridum]|uniref:Transcriptional regulator, contains XRE-family HTH domain n=1 Tax=Kibdelosporangium aridum TaxID=2030 RepID=A0A1Y5YC50_KIBAR|nr:helix-turn-helix transcriptional regulator [Kibdelosporangium aridum]SMD27430.1 Transcriptional regulator, contains XRE-family HTH domain [Kibdelosporangium aridum]
MAPKREGLAQRRKARGLTQEALADKLGVGRYTVQRWEAGLTEPQPWLRPRLAKELDVSCERLDYLLSGGETDDVDLAPVRVCGHDQPESDEMRRRELLRLFSTVGTLAALPAIDPDRTAYAAEHPSHLDLATLDEYAQLNGQLWQTFLLAPSKGDAMPLVRHQLDILCTGLKHQQDDIVRQRLLALTADLLQLAGEIYFDANAYTDAAHSYTLAADASKTAQDYDLWACAMVRHSFVALYDRQFADAAPMLDLAAAVAERGDRSLSTRHWVSVVHAHAFAGLGDHAACERALDQAEQVRQLDGTVHNGGWLRFDGARLAEERGACYVTLGRHDLAETVLNDALTHRLTTRRRATVLTDLAMIGVHRRDPDKVATYAQTALNLARRTRSGVIARKLQALQPKLAPLLADKQVHKIHTEIAELATV